MIYLTIKMVAPKLISIYCFVWVYCIKTTFWFWNCQLAKYIKFILLQPICKQYLGRMSLKIITGDMKYLIVWKSFTIHRYNILPSVLKFLKSVFYNFIFVSLPNQSHTGGGGEPVTDNGCFSASLPPPLNNHLECT